ncbi:MAG: phosphatidylserine decarboxylase family protein [Acidobacteriota bacterium]|nr:MAG: phosphatidylserine decarboxylase family protein [Acidobacteriota bacterium]
MEIAEKYKTNRVLRDAYPFIIPLVILAALFLILSWIPGSGVIAGVLAALAIFVAFFFRNPERVIPEGENLIVSPADGLVVVVRPEGGGETLVSIFLSVFDVHVNRSPIGGRIVSSEHRPGKFLAANLERASIENEQQVVTTENDSVRVVYKLIAGLIARRVVFWKREGDLVGRGERVGLIKFGSRVDILLPSNVTVRVKKGDRVKGGESVIGEVHA